MLKYLYRDKKFLLSSFFIVSLLLLSIGNSIIFDGEIKQTNMKFDSNGDFISSPPFPPSFEHPLGTDIHGYDLLNIIIEGSKYTIGSALIVTILRIGIAFLFSSLLSTYLYKWIPLLRTITEPFTIIPQILIAYFLLVNVLIIPPDGKAEPFIIRALFETIVLTFIAIPTLTLHITSLMRSYWNEDFIETSKVLGGTKLHIFSRHILPRFSEQGILLFLQQFIQVLTIFAHLGVLKIFFGGTFVDYSQVDAPKTLSYEWSGLIGSYYPLLKTKPWIPLIPIIFYTLTVISLVVIKNSIRDALHSKDKNIKEIINS
ncbi:ABC transporter permease [Metabacillus sp. 22489]|uniref:ABC transporter permease n=1 Tax=Metabacillus sp. 22489 TaxID=3453928 RepID=UPI003F86D23D